MVDSFAVRLKSADGECDATASSLKDWKATALIFFDRRSVILEVMFQAKIIRFFETLISE
jgi:hypothetical protein